MLERRKYSRMAACNYCVLSELSKERRKRGVKMEPLSNDEIAELRKLIKERLIEREAQYEFNCKMAMIGPP